jgi:poly(beta-D-mannuronate) lyase
MGAAGEDRSMANFLRRFFTVLAAAQFANLATGRISAAEYLARSGKEVRALNKQLQPGDAVVLAEGVWQNQRIVFRGRGTKEQPITLRAQTPGKVILNGSSTVTIEGEFLEASGLYFQGSKLSRGLYVDIMDKLSENAVEIRGRHCRLTESALVDCRCRKYVLLTGAHHRVDHCYFSGSKVRDAAIVVDVDHDPHFHRIDHNHFGPQLETDETASTPAIRLGQYSAYAARSSSTAVEANVFDRVSNGDEIIASNMSENVFRSNTFIDCAGMLTLRHGNRCLVDGNFFIGHRRKGAGGVRVFGGDHTISNNYLDGMSQGAFAVLTAKVNAATPDETRYAARNCVIAHNTVVNSRGPLVTLNTKPGAVDWLLTDYESEEWTSFEPADDVTVVNNIFNPVERRAVVSGKQGDNWRWKGNLTANALKSPGFQLIDLQLEQGADGVWRPGRESPARGAADGDFARVEADIDGEPRREPCDVGCDQVYAGGETRRPLSAMDVGPWWLERTCAVGLVAEPRVAQERRRN